MITGDTVATAKAQQLCRHAAYLGVRAREFSVLLSLQEALELVEALAIDYEEDENFQADLLLCRKRRDPWPILANFRLFDLDILDAAKVLQ